MGKYLIQVPLVGTALTEWSASLQMRREVVRLRQRAFSTFKDAQDPQYPEHERERLSRTADAMIETASFIEYFDLNHRLERKGILVPSEYLDAAKRDTFTTTGRAWVQRELRKAFLERVEFWFKLVLPILSLVLSIIALLHKR